MRPLCTLTLILAAVAGAARAASAPPADAGVAAALRAAIVRVEPNGPPPPARPRRGDSPVDAQLGLLWDDAGHVVTVAQTFANHGGDITVVLPDGSRRAARVLRKGLFRNLVVLQVQGPLAGAHPLPLGASRELQVGQSVVAVEGLPGIGLHVAARPLLELDHRIGADDRRALLVDEIGVDAGSPMVDATGHLVGLVVGRPRDTMLKMAALRSDDLAAWVPQLIAEAGEPRPRLGIAIEDLDRERFGREYPQGVVVSTVRPGSAAERAGLLPPDGAIADIIIGVDGQRVPEIDNLLELLDGHHVGDSLALDVWRQGQRRKLTLVLEAPTLAP